MHAYLSTHPQALALLQDAKEHPEDDTPRLVLADWLEEHGDCCRAEFIRLQCLLAPGGCKDAPVRAAAAARSRELLGRHGGGWLGSLWRWWLSPAEWHRGLLSVRLPRDARPDSIQDVLSWVDTVIFVVQGRQGLHRAAEVLSALAANHAYIDLRRPLGEEALFDALAFVPGSRCLRTLSFAWPLGLLRRQDGGEGQPRMAPAASCRFLTRLVRECPLGRHLTHVGSSAPFSAGQAKLLRDVGVEAADALDRLWMHRLPRSCFGVESTHSTGPPA